MTKQTADQPLITTSDALHINENGLTQACDYLDANNPLTALNYAARCQRDTERLIEVAVTQLRADGCPWSEIGRKLGVTRQAAQQRFGAL